MTVQGDKDGGSVTVKDGDTSITGKGSFAGDSFGLKAAVKGLAFEAQIRKDSGTKEWSKFNATVKIPIAGRRRSRAARRWRRSPRRCWPPRRRSRT